MPRPESDPADFRGVAARVFEACEVGFAVVSGPQRTVAWSNRAFCEGAATRGLDAAGLARAILRGQQGGSVAPLPDETGSDSEPQWLITLQAGGESVAPGQSTLDSVTGVLSRGALDATLDAWFAERALRPFSLVFIDLVDFKQVNDCLGHVAGDECLAEVGRRLGRALRTGDIVGRYGGDEFLLLLQGKPAAEAASAIRRRIEAEVGAPLNLRGQMLRLSLSFGAATSDQGATPTELVSLADAAMYADKRRNRREMPA